MEWLLWTACAAFGADAGDLLARIEPTPDAVAAMDAAPPRWTRAPVAIDPRNRDFRRLQRSALRLNRAQLRVLETHGLVIADNLAYHSFAEAFEQVYFEDQPLFVSADAILHAMHRTYDDTLAAIERARLVDDLRAALEHLRADPSRLDDFPPEVRADVAEYLQVAADLLAGRDGHPIVARALAASGTGPLEVFGQEQEVDWSQFTPRGHYQGTDLEPYFRAMIWLGRTDLRIVTTDAGEPVLHRRALLGAMALSRLAEGPAADPLGRIDRVVRAFVGPVDSLDPAALGAVLAPLGAAGPAEVAALTDAELLAALAEAPEQRILSHVLRYHPEIDGPKLVLPVSFLLLGQRYTVDSHVLASVVYGGVGEKRMMPDPLDAAYAALGNDDALPLLDGVEGEYAEALLRTRRLVDAHPAAYWEGSLYTRWLAALRTLSSSDPEGSPGTPAWGRRLVHTQLASWAELRHDTLLYAKQSYTATALCAFPDAWVEPNPAFWQATEAYAGAAIALLESLPLDPPLAGELLEPQRRLAEAARVLGEMAVRQRNGEPFTARQMAFVNQAVRRKFQSNGCARELVDVVGWYPELFLDPLRAVEYDPTIADVHTQPTDAVGNPVGRVLHVATGKPRIMAIAVQTCNGPQVFVGPVSSYHEVVTEGFERLDDLTWMGRVDRAQPVPWIADLVVD